MNTNWRTLTQTLLERPFTRREFILYLLALIPVLIGLNGLIRRLLEAEHHLQRGSGVANGYGSRLYGK